MADFESPDPTMDESAVQVAAGSLSWVSAAGTDRRVDLKGIVGVVRNPSSSPGYRVLFLDSAQSEGGNNDSLTRLSKLDISTLPSGLSPFLVDVPSHLRREEPVQVVISTRSGTGTAKAVFHDIVEPFLQYMGLEYRVFETQSAQTILELSRSHFLKNACAGIPQTILLLSGDGGLVDLVDVFYKSTNTLHVAPDIGIIPCGTGNAMASSIGLRSGPASGLQALLRGQPCPVPSFAARFSPGSQLVLDEGRKRAPVDFLSDGPHQTIYGAVVASWGLHAALVADSDTAEYRKFGSERFKMAAKELLHPADGTSPHRFQGQITMTTSDAQTGEKSQYILKESEHMYVLATLVPRLEKDFLISPYTEPLGGQMRFLRFGPLSGDEAMRLMMLAYQGGKHVQDDLVTYEEIERLRIDFHEDLERWRRVCIDGKIVAVGQGGWMELSKEPRHLLNIIKSGE
jgi:diacylglycerol kinase family enzyme